MLCGLCFRALSKSQNWPVGPFIGLNIRTPRPAPPRPAPPQPGWGLTFSQGSYRVLNSWKSLEICPAIFQPWKCSSPFRNWNTVEPALSGHPWGTDKWPLNRSSLEISIILSRNMTFILKETEDGSSITGPQLVATFYLGLHFLYHILEI